MILRIFGESEDLVPVLVSPTGIDTFFCDRKMDRSRTSGGVGRCPAACYVGRCIVQVACATFGDVLRAPKNFNPDDTFFCALFPQSTDKYTDMFSGEALKSTMT